MRTLTILGALTVMLTSTICSAQTAGWKNALKPSGKTVAFVVTKDNNAACTILLPKSPTAAETKSAEELSYWLWRITDIYIPVVKETDKLATSKVISIGKTSLAARSGVWATASKLKEEGYAIVSKGNNMYLLGGKRRGPLYATYALLEEDLGCRWYTQRSDDVIPSTRNLTINYAPRHYSPLYETRMPGVGEAFDNNWMLRNRINPFMFGNIPAELGGSTEAVGGAHTFFRLLSPDKYFASNPEYFSELSGKRVASQLCLTNPDVVRIVTDSVRDIFKNSKARYVAISPMDGMPLCQCENCKAIDDAEGTKMGSLLTFLNKIARNIKSEFPDRRILTLAYLDYYYPPKTIKPEPSVTIQLCTDSHAWAYPFCMVNETDKYAKALELWRKTGADIVIWDYVNNYDHNLMPFPNMQVVGNNLKWQAAHGAGGMFLQGDCWSKGTDSGYMRAWVWAKQLWNPNLDTFKLMKDFVYGYYGPAADAIWKYEMLKESLWTENHKKPHNIRTKPTTTIEENPLMVDGIRWAPTVSLYTPEFMSQGTAFLEEALSACQTFSQMKKVKAVKMQMDYLRLCKGLGYFNSMKQYFKSEEVIQKDKTNFPLYMKILDELTETVNYEGVRNFYEVYGTSDAPIRLAKWKNIMTVDEIVLPLVSLSHEWKFTTDPEKQGDEKQYYAEGFDDSSWKSIVDNVGFGWTSQGYEHYTGFGWYRQAVNVPADIDSKKYLYLFFGAVDEEAWVYINGKFAFERTFKSTGLPGEVIWNMPFMQDVKGLIKPGQPNLIAVKVNNVANAGGIWQPVHLLPTDEQWTAQQVFDNL